jgi:hypothetical protein
MKKPLSGNTDEALTIPATDCRELISGANFDGQGAVFHCLAMWFYNSHATTDSVVQVYDQDEAAATAANERFSIVCPFGVLTEVTFPEPGMLFKINITAAVTGGTIAIYQAGAMGYTTGGQ